MKMDDWDLIRAYCRRRETSSGSSDDSTPAPNEAFAELVRRHIHLVYSAALRSLAGDRSLAEDVTQKTFSLLAAKAEKFTPGISLVGWLYKTACNLSRDALRTETRRRHRELEAMKMQSTDPTSEPAARWEEIAPLLEDAMLSLPDKERALILLRFFERKPFREVAAALEITEEAARMRASRALQRLRKFLSQRGVAISSLALGNLLLESAVAAAPTSLIASLLATAPLTLAATSIPIIPIIPLSLTSHWVFMTTLQKTSLIAAAMLLLIGSGTAFHLWRSNSTHFANRNATPRPAPFTEAKQGAAEAQTEQGTESTASASTRLDRAIANLRRAITEEWPERRLPMARLRDAITDFGADRQAAVPVLLEYLNGPRAARSLTSMVGAAYCLELLGTDASAALPDLLILLRSGDLALLNDFIPRLFVALSPDGAVVPELLDAMSSQTPHGGQQLIAALEQLFEMNPAVADTHRPQISARAQTGDLASALLLARMPGPRDPAAVPVLTNALHVARLNVGLGADYITDDGLPLVYHMHESNQDDVSRLAAIQALGKMGSAASNALPALIEFANRVQPKTGFNLRELALVAIGNIDPSYRASSPEIERAVYDQERTMDIVQKARAGTASIDELTEGLHLRNAADSAAEALARHPEARAAIPDLVQAIDEFESSSAVDLLKKLDPQLLIDRVKANDTRALNDVAQALGELGPDAREALPHLVAILDATHPADENRGRPHALDEAIHRIDPGQPKLLYTYADLEEAQFALQEAIRLQNKYQSPMHDAFIRDFQDINAVSRGHLLRFVETLKADPALHKPFVKALLKTHPDLADLGDAFHTGPNQTTD